MVFLEKKNITKWEHLSDAAKTVGLNAEKLKADYNGEAKAAFQEDLELARKMGVRGFPTMFFNNTEHELTVYRFRPYQNYTTALVQLYPEAQKKSLNTQTLFESYPTLTTKEYAVLAGISTEKAKDVLEKLLSKQEVRRYDIKNGTLWIKNKSLK
jgi:hypothetical protein